MTDQATFVVTFPVGGPLADQYSTIKAASETVARLALIGVYGRAGWSGIYTLDADSVAMIERHSLEWVPFGHGHETAQDYVA